MTELATSYSQPLSFGKPFCLGFTYSVLFHVSIIAYSLIYYNSDPYEDRHIQEPKEEFLIVNFINIPEHASDKTVIYEDSNINQSSGAGEDYDNHKKEPIIESKNADFFVPKKGDGKPKIVQSEFEYGIILAAHIQKFADRVNKEIEDGYSLEIVVKIDNNGKLLSYNIIGPYDPDANNLIDRILNSASPFPIPPQKYLKNNAISYKFNLSI